MKKMKKILFAGVLLAAACGLCGCDEAPQQVAQTVPVDVMTSVVIHNDDNSTETINYVYDERGNLLSDKSEGDVASSWWESAYDEADNLISSTMYESDGEAVERILYAYDENGMNTEIKIFTMDGGDWVWNTYDRIEYDDAGNMLVVDIDERVNGDHYRWEYTYDADGNLLRDLCVGADGEFWGETEYDYVDGLNVGGRDLAENGDVISSWVIKHDAAGNMTLWENETVRMVYTYDKDGNRLSEVNYNLEDGRWQLSDRTDYTYDAEGRVLTEISYFGDGELSSGTAYTYDEQGRTLAVAGIDENGEWRTIYENVYGQIDVLEDCVDNALAQQEDL